MRFLPSFLASLLTALPSLPAGAAEPPPLPEYRAPRANTPPLIDGRLDDPAWAAAPLAGDFVFTWFREGIREQTRARLLWDDTHLYLAFECDDRHITARHTERDGRIPEDDCVELMLMPDPAKPDVYFNLEFNVIGGLLDNFRPHGPNRPRAPRWDAEGVRLAGTYEGTLNDDADVDRVWRVEVAIPWRNFAAHAPATPPRPGTVLRMNLNRHGGRTNPQYSQWAQALTPKPSFHTPDRFGHLILEASPAAPRP